MMKSSIWQNVLEQIETGDANSVYMELTNNSHLTVILSIFH